MQNLIEDTDYTMESLNLNLSIPRGKGSLSNPSISYCRGNVFHLKASLKPHKGPASGEGEKKEGEEEEEEGRTDSQKRDHFDAFDLGGWKENIKQPGELSKIVNPNQLLPLSLECQAFTRMGNQQGMKIKPLFQGDAEGQATMPKSPRFQIPRKRRKRGEKPIYFTDSVPRSKLTTRTLPSNEKVPSRIQITSSSTFGGWKLEDDRHIFCTPAPRRKRILRSQHNFKPLLGLKSLEALTADCSVSQNSTSFPQKDLPAKKASSLQDSDTDHSEYDELSSVLIYPCSKEPARTTKKGAWDEPKCPIIQPEIHEDKEKRKLGRKNSARVSSKMAKKEAAERVRRKIEELEDIIHQVSLNSLSQRRQEESKYPFNIPIRDEKSLQNAFPEDTGTQLVEEFQALSEALSQSLRQVLKVEGAREEKLLVTSSESSRLIPVSYSDQRASNWPNNTDSNSHLAQVETTSFPPSSPMLDVSEGTYASIEGTSPILSPLFSSSHKSLTVRLTCQQGVVSDQHTYFVGTALSPQWFGECEEATKDSGRTEKENGNCWYQGNIRQSERDQALASNCINKKDILSSGNCAYQVLHQEV